MEGLEDSDHLLGQPAFQIKSYSLPPKKKKEMEGLRKKLALEDQILGGAMSRDALPRHYCGRIYLSYKGGYRAHTREDPEIYQIWTRTRQTKIIGQRKPRRSTSRSNSNCHETQQLSF